MISYTFVFNTLGELTRVDDIREAWSDTRSVSVIHAKDLISVVVVEQDIASALTAARAALDIANKLSKDQIIDLLLSIDEALDNAKQAHNRSVMLLTSQLEMIRKLIEAPLGYAEIRKKGKHVK